MVNGKMLQRQVSVHIIIGIIGRFLGNFLLGLLGISSIVGIGWLDSILTGAIGAVVLIFVGRLIFK